jgi:hypothetical protein
MIDEDDQGRYSKFNEGVKGIVSLHRQRQWGQERAALIKVCRHCLHVKKP